MTTAQYHGECAAACGFPIEEGQLIEYWDDLGDSGWRHVKCPAEPRRLAACPRCGLEHPGEC